jgi:hypothetical protein
MNPFLWSRLLSLQAYIWRIALCDLCLCEHVGILHEHALELNHWAYGKKLIRAEERDVRNDSIAEGGGSLVRL